MKMFRGAALVLTLMACLGVSVAAMTAHGGWIEENSGQIACQGSMWYADSTRLVTVRIFDPNGQQIAFASQGANSIGFRPVVYPSVAAAMSGTYHCNVVFEEEHRNLTYEYDEQDYYLTR